MEKGRRNEGGGARKKTTKHAPALHTLADAASEISLSVLAPLQAILMGRRSVGRRAFAPCRLFRQARRRRMRGRRRLAREARKGGRGGRGGRKEVMSTIPLNNALGTDAESKHQKCTSTCEGRPTPTPLVKEGEGRQGLDPGTPHAVAAKASIPQSKEGRWARHAMPLAGQGLQGKTLDFHKPSSTGEEGQGGWGQQGTVQGDGGSKGEEAA